MKPAPFDYLPCSSKGEALACLAQYGDEAAILAGGQSLTAILNMRMADPRVLADIGRIAALSTISSDEVQTTIGAGVTQAAAMRHLQIQTNVPLAARALPHIGHYQTRNRGTICGSLAHGDPAAELPLIACVLNADINLESIHDSRSVSAQDFFEGPLQTCRRDDEIVASVSFAHAKHGEAYGFNEVAMRHGDFAITAVAVKLTSTSITIGIGGGPDKPEIREWPALDGSALDDALNGLAWEMEFQSDFQASSMYRRRMVRAIGRKTVAEARQCL